MLCSLGSESRVGNSIVDPKWDNCDAGLFTAEILHEFGLHLFRMNEDMIGQPILDSQRKPIER